MSFIRKNISLPNTEFGKDVTQKVVYVDLVRNLAEVIRGFIETPNKTLADDIPGIATPRIIIYLYDQFINYMILKG